MHRQVMFKQPSLPDCGMLLQTYNAVFLAEVAHLVCGSVSGTVLSTPGITDTMPSGVQYAAAQHRDSGWVLVPPSQRCARNIGCRMIDVHSYCNLVYKYPFLRSARGILCPEGCVCDDGTMRRAIDSSRTLAERIRCTSKYSRPTFL